MNKPKRFASSGALQDSSTGNWVQYDDYEAVADKLADVEDQWRKSREDVDSLNAEIAGRLRLLPHTWWTARQTDVHANAAAHGWWEYERNEGEMIALMHSELSEALEAVRDGNPPSDHCPEFSGLEEEFADVVIRIMDMAQHHKLRIPEAIDAKMAYNLSRPYKHGHRKF